MSKYIKMGAGILLVVVLAFFYAHIDKNTYLYDRKADTSTFLNTGILLEGETISQTFLSKEELLSGVNIKCGITGDVRNVTLKYSFIETDTGKELASGAKAADEIENNKFNVLTVDTFQAEIGKAYTLKLEEVGSNEANGVSFYIVPEKKDFVENVLVKEAQTQGVLAVRSISHQFDAETFFVLLGFVIFIIIFMRLLYRLFK